MADYSDIRGYRVKYLSSDPTLNTSTEGQVWYNSTEGTLKSLVQIKAWSAGGSMSTARYSLAGCGSQTAGLGFGGYSTANTNATEEYSGYTWTGGGNLNTARQELGGAGTQTAGLGFGGSLPGSPPITAATEEYNGTAWTTVNNMGTAVWRHGGLGIQTSALSFGGTQGDPQTATTQTEEYDGTSWTAGGTLNTARSQLAGAGIGTSSGLAFGGANPSGTILSNSEEYNGSSWTSVNPINTARQQLVGAGIQTNAIGFAGSTFPGPLSSATEEYDGNIWTNSTASLSTARSGLSGAGVRSSAIAFAGLTPSVSAATEEYNSTIQGGSRAVWASGGNLSVARVDTATAGTSPTTAITFGGYGTPVGYHNTTEEYNGSTWASGGNYPTPIASSAAFGIQTAAIGAGGEPASATPPPGYRTAAVNSYNGTSWTTATSLPGPRSHHMAAGTQTAGLVCGGSPQYSPWLGTDTTVEYSGGSWTSGGNLNSVNLQAMIAGSGTQTATLLAGGNTGPGGTGTYLSTAQSYDGTSWTASPSLNTAKYSAGGSGVQTSMVIAGGLSSPSVIVSGTEEWNGTSWQDSTTNLGTARRGFVGGAGSSSSSSLITGGYNTGFSVATEEYTGSTLTNTASTLTTS